MIAHASKWLDPRPLIVLTMIVLLVCIVLMVTIDKPAAFFIDRTMSAAGVQFWRDVSRLGKADTHLVILVVLYLGGRALFLWTAPLGIARWYAHLARIGLFGLASYALSGAVVQILKNILGRYRPKHLIQDGVYGFSPFSPDWSFNSFPSGHSQSAFTIACVLSLVFPRATWFFLTLAATIAFSRVLNGAHFPSDIIFGSYVGIVSVLLVRRYWFPEIGSAPVNPACYAG